MWVKDPREDTNLSKPRSKKQAARGGAASAEFVPWFSIFGDELVTLGWGFNHYQRR